MKTFLFAANEILVYPYGAKALGGLLSKLFLISHILGRCIFSLGVVVFKKEFSFLSGSEDFFHYPERL